VGRQGLPSNRMAGRRVRGEPVTVEPAGAAALQELPLRQIGQKSGVVNVWANLVRPCVAEFDDLIETNLRFRHRDFELVRRGPVPDEKDKVLKFFSSTMRQNTQPDFRRDDKYKPWRRSIQRGRAPSHTLVLGRDGTVLYSQDRRAGFPENPQGHRPRTELPGPGRG